MKEIFLNLMQPCCGLEFLELKRFINAISLTNESKRQVILQELGTNGKLSTEGWFVFAENAQLDNDIITANEIKDLATNDCKFPTCENWKTLIDAVGFNVLPFNVTFKNIENSFFDVNGNGLAIENVNDFKFALKNGYNYDYDTQNMTKIGFKDVYITDFVIDGNQITCNLYANANYSFWSLLADDITSLGGIVNLSGFFTENLTEANSKNVLRDFLNKSNSTISRLSIINSGLTDFESGDWNLPNLRYLDLSTNQIDVFSINSTKIEYLYLGSNMITEINYNIPNIVALALNENPITEFKPNNDLPKLRYLYLSETLITEFRPNSKMYNLIELRILGNLFSTFNPIYDFPKLKRLSIQENTMTDFNPSIEMKSLEFLNLSDSKIQNFNPTRQLPNLFELDLFRNPFAEFNPSIKLDKLEILRIQKTNIISFNPSTPMPSLRNLNLIDNKINNWTGVNWISYLKNIGSASLGGNQTSASGSPMQSALVAKGWNVTV